MTSGTSDPLTSSQAPVKPKPWLRRFAKLTCAATLFLIFAGGMVTSTGSGLAVPDWPLSYGSFFPPMVGGVFYEHGHRMVASLVGFLMLTMAIWIGLKEERLWLRITAFIALGAVILQGVLGGITVLTMLPTPVSVMHGVLAQTFFLLTIFIAYALSIERRLRPFQKKGESGAFLRINLLFVALVYLQLILGAVMRHTESGLAIGDFPKMGGYWIPPMNEEMLNTINIWRFEHNLDFVTIDQVYYHLFHRLGALLVLIGLCLLNYFGIKTYKGNKTVMRTLYCLDGVILLQITLGIATVLSLKEPLITSLHVVTGAATLGLSFLLLLRTAPLSFKMFKEAVLS